MSISEDRLRQLYDAAWKYFIEYQNDEMPHSTDSYCPDNSFAKTALNIARYGTAPYSVCQTFLNREPYDDWRDWFSTRGEWPRGTDEFFAEPWNIDIWAEFCRMYGPDGPDRPRRCYHELKKRLDEREAEIEELTGEKPSSSWLKSHFVPFVKAAVSGDGQAVLTAVGAAMIDLFTGNPELAKWYEDALGLSEEFVPLDVSVTATNITADPEPSPSPAQPTQQSRREQFLAWWRALPFEWKRYYYLSWLYQQQQG